MVRSITDRTGTGRGGTGRGRTSRTREDLSGDDRFGDDRCGGEQSGDVLTPTSVGQITSAAPVRALPAANAPGPGAPSPPRTTPPAATGDAAEAVSTEYRVGYRRPPQATRFTPGMSGNPSGRPRGRPSLRGLIDKIANAKVTVTEAGRRVRRSKLEVAITQLANKAAGGDIKALRMTLDLLAAVDPAETRPDVTPDLFADRAQALLIVDRLSRAVDRFADPRAGAGPDAGGETGAGREAGAGGDARADADAGAGADVGPNAEADGDRRSLAPLDAA